MTWMHFRQSVNIHYGGQNFNMAVSQGYKGGNKPGSGANMIKNEAKTYIIQKV